MSKEAVALALLAHSMKNLQLIAKEIGISEAYLKKIKAEHLQEGKHYYKKLGRIYFDEVAVFNWIKESDENIQQKQSDLGGLLERWREVS